MAAVISELSAQSDAIEVQFWCDRRFAPQARAIMQHTTVPVVVRTVISGKLRRYHGVSLGRQLLDIPTVVKNVIDAFKIVAGFLQSLMRLLIWRPNVVFTKGGFVCLPIGIAAHVLRIPLVIHDSDTLPGLTNRVLARFAKHILTGSPLENYNYSPTIASYVGIPIAKEFYPRTEAERRQIKQHLQMPPELPLIVATGGGQGARRINDALLAVAPKLAGKATVVHIAGAADEAYVRRKAPVDPNYKVFGFVSKEMSDLFGAADIVISRAGANALQELAASAAPTIIIPNGFLTGGHQLKNAAVFAKAKAAIVLLEAEIETPKGLLDAIEKLLASPELRQSYRDTFCTFARPDAAKQTASVIINTAKKQRT